MSEARSSLESGAEVFKPVHALGRREADHVGAPIAPRVDTSPPQLVDEDAPVAACGEHEESRLEGEQQGEQRVDPQRAARVRRADGSRAHRRAEMLLGVASAQRGRVIEQLPPLRRRAAKGAEGRRVLRGDEDGGRAAELVPRDELVRRVDVPVDAHQRVLLALVAPAYVHRYHPLRRAAFSEDLPVRPLCRGDHLLREGAEEELYPRLPHELLVCAHRRRVSAAADSPHVLALHVRLGRPPHRGPEDRGPQRPPVAVQVCLIHLLRDGAARHRAKVTL
mmetsp:Transcript_34887/g.84787  ORF Transcript_34887/g.84787 Transcript_34887/m.84787 type:complete len:279 (-) Transcript_34887:691-1527(-)